MAGILVPAPTLPFISKEDSNTETVSASTLPDLQGNEKRDWNPQKENSTAQYKMTPGGMEVMTPGWDYARTSSYVRTLQEPRQTETGEATTTAQVTGIPKDGIPVCTPHKGRWSMMATV